MNNLEAGQTHVEFMFISFVVGTTISIILGLIVDDVAGLVWWRMSCVMLILTVLIIIVLVRRSSRAILDYSKNRGTRYEKGKDLLNV